MHRRLEPHFFVVSGLSAPCGPRLCLRQPPPSGAPPRLALLDAADASAQWSWASSSSSGGALVNRRTGLALALPRCPAERWSHSAEDRSLRPESDRSLCLDVDRARAEDGADVVLWRWTAAANQRWTLAEAPRELLAPGEFALLSLNCYLMPALWAAGGNESCVRQAERARGVGELVSRGLWPHCAALLEVWGAGICELQSALAQSHVPAAFHARWPGCPELVDVALRWAAGTGGLYMARVREVPLLWSAREVFRASSTRSGKGCAGMLLGTERLWPAPGQPRAVLVIATHLDPDNSSGTQPLQLQQVAEFADRSLGEASRATGIPYGQLCCLVCGDMNIASGSPLYRLMLSAPGRTWRDLWAGRDEATYGESTLCMYRSPMRIDYVLAVDEAAGHRLARLRATYRMLVKQKPGEELSDHWGLLTRVVPE
eukprot:m51a1_g1984 hypothetical protein (430) ;mRNA; f:1138464-1139913